MMWKQDSRKSKDGANEQEIALDKQSKAARNDEQPENAESKKKAVLIVLGALLALSLAVGMVNCAASYKQTESVKNPSPAQTKKETEVNLNADKEKVEEESQKAEDEVTDEPSNGDTGESKPETGGNSSSGGGNGDSAGGGNSGSNGGGESKPQHVHNWVPQTTVVHHEAQVQTVHHDAIYKTVCICNGCNAQFDTDNAWGAHSESQLLAGNYACGSYHPSNIVIQDAWDETVEISPAWDETVTTGYACSGCGAIK